MINKNTTKYLLICTILFALMFFASGCAGTSNNTSSTTSPNGSLNVLVLGPSPAPRDSSSTDRGAYVPLSGVRVSVLGQNLYSTTNSNGYATIDNVPAGTYTVTIGKEGYQAAIYTNIIVAGGAGTLVGPAAGVDIPISTAPYILDVSSLSGPVRTTLTITGSNFGASQGSSAVAFNGTSAAPTSWSETQIVCKVPAGATSGNLVVTVGGAASNSITFTVTPGGSPRIDSITPSSGVVGTSVTIAGSDFGLSRGSSTITFNGISVASVTGWSDTSIACVVPAGATTGNVIVTVEDVASNAAAFTVGPKISGLSLTSGVVGTSVTITGTTFGPIQSSSTIKFNGMAATVTDGNWHDTSIICNVPTGATTGNVVVTVGGVASNGVVFTVGPKITGIDPASGAIGDAVTITGTTFGATQSTSTVTFGGAAATITEGNWHDTSIVCNVPTGATTGNVVVTVGGVVSEFAFTVLPKITSLSVSEGHWGDSVTITGTGFGATEDANVVKFYNNKTASIGTCSATSIVCIVPSNAQTGNITVTVGGNTSNGISFVVLEEVAVYKTSNQTTANNTLTALNFQTEAFDTASMWSADNPSKLYCKTSGKYLIWGNAYFVTGGGAYRRLNICKNGITTIWDGACANNGAWMTVQACFVTDLAEGDYIEMRVLQDSGGDLAVDGTAGYGANQFGMKNLTRATVGEEAAVYKTSNQTIANNTLTALNFQAEAFDTAGMWSAGNPSKLYCKTSGTHLMWGNAYFLTGAGAYRRLNIGKSEATTIWDGGFANGGAWMTVGNAFVANLTADDYIEMRVLQDSGGNLAVDGDNGYGANQFGIFNLLNLAKNEEVAVYKTSDQTIANDTLTALNFQAEAFDTAAMWSIGNPSKLYCKTSGKYLIWGNAYFVTGGGSYRRLNICKNGITTMWDGGLSNNGAWMTVDCAFVADLTEGDYIEMRVLQDSGGGLAIDGTTGYGPNQFGMKFLSGN